MQWSDGHCPSFSPALYSLTPSHSPRVTNTSPDAGLFSGRAPVQFIEHDETRLVRKQYRRGGLAQHVTKEHYVWTGFSRTRAVREVHLLADLYASQLPVPRPVGCKIERNPGRLRDGFGLFYRNWLLTEEIADCRGLNAVLSASVSDDKKLPLDWSYIGSELARFRQANVYHADLNASNILLDASGSFYLIDFDRARRINNGSNNKKLHQRMLSRLLRSIDKLETQVKGLSVSKADRDKLASAFWGN